MQGLSVFGTYSNFCAAQYCNILAIWLALRIANNIRNAEDDNIVAKILGTGLVFDGDVCLYWRASY